MLSELWGFGSQMGPALEKYLSSFDVDKKCLRLFLQELTNSFFFSFLFLFPFSLLLKAGGPKSGRVGRTVKEKTNELLGLKDFIFIYLQQQKKQKPSA